MLGVSRAEGENRAGTGHVSIAPTTSQQGPAGLLVVGVHRSRHRPKGMSFVNQNWALVGPRGGPVLGHRRHLRIKLGTWQQTRVGRGVFRHLPPSTCFSKGALQREAARQHSGGLLLPLLLDNLRPASLDLSRPISKMGTHQAAPGHKETLLKA